MGQYCSCAKGKKKKVPAHRNKPVSKDALWHQEAFDYKSTNHKQSNKCDNNVFNNGFQNNKIDNSIKPEGNSKYNSLTYSTYNQWSNYSHDCNNSSSHDINNNWNFLTHPINASFQDTHLNHNNHEDYSQNSLSHDTSTNLDHTSLDHDSSLLTTNASHLDLEVHAYRQRNSQKVVSLLEKVLDYLVQVVDVSYIQAYCQRVKWDVERGMVEKEGVRNLMWDVLTGQEGEDFGVFCELLSDNEEHKGVVELLICLEGIVSLVSTFPHPSQLPCQHNNPLSETSYFSIDLVTPLQPTIHHTNLSSSISLCSLNAKSPSRPPIFLRKQLPVPLVALTLGHFCFCSSQQEGRLLQMLSEFQCLLELGLVRCNFSQETSFSFVQALSLNRSLQKLHISSSPLHPSPLHPSSFQLFLQALAALKPTLKSFSFTHCHATTPLLHSLLTTLSTQLFLQELDLSFNQLSIQLTTALSHLLATTTTLKHLTIKNTHLTPASFVPLSTSLSHNSTLHSLNISNNDLQDSSINSLSHSLILNSSVRSINLSNCSFSHSAAVGISRLLRANHSIQQLIISNNHLNNHALSILSSGLCYNQSLLHLEMDSCGVGNVGFHHLLKALKHHRRIRVVKLCYNLIGRPDAGGDGGDHSVGVNGAHRGDVNGSNGQIINEKINFCTNNTIKSYINKNKDNSADNNNNNGVNDVISEESLFLLMKEVLHLNPHLKLVLRGNQLATLLAS